MRVNRRNFIFGTACAGMSSLALAQLPGRIFPGSLQAFPRTNGAGTLRNAREFGARGDGRNDDRSAIQAAIDSVSRSGGGTVVLPAGVYLVSPAGDSAVAISLRSGVTLQGEGPSTVIRLRAGSGGHTINVTGERGCRVRNLTIDGNRALQSSTGHAFRSGGVDDLLLENLSILNAYHYGIGLESGSNRGVIIRNVEIAGCGADGIDIKNKNNNNTTVLIAGVSVRRWGLRNGTKTQAGIDCRGPVQLRDIRVSDPAAMDGVGIRMRQGEAGEINGIGAHHARLEGFDVRMGAGRAQVGIEVVARSVTVSDGSVSGGFRGMAVHASGLRANGVKVSGCSDIGILLDAHGAGLDADDAVLSNCTVTACGGDGIEIETDDVQVLDCTSTGSAGYGISVTETANRATVLRGNFARNRAGGVLNRGRGSRFANSAN
jgi:hypothetical protein